MKIVEITSKTEKENCFHFFRIMWKDLFGIDLELDREKTLNNLNNNSILYGIYSGEEIISLIQFIKCEKGFTLSSGYTTPENAYILGRVGTLEQHRQKGHGSKLIKHGIQKIKKLGINDFYIPSELSNIKYYEKFGFETFGQEVQSSGSAKYIYMKNK